MRNIFQLILAASVAAVLVFASCSRDEAEVIPRSKLARIYAEMLVTDQWVLSTPGVRTIADTSLVYEPILRKYGYDSEDYRRSVDVYMDDPERFARIFRETGEILEKRLKHLKKEKEHLRKQQEKERDAMKYRTDFKPEEFFPYIFKEPYVHYYDSVSFVPDSTLMVYRLVPVETADTTYSGLEMIVHVDTVSVADTSSSLESAMDKDSVDVIMEVPELKPEPAAAPKPVLRPKPESEGMVKEERHMVPMHLPDEGLLKKKNVLKKDGDK